MRLSKHDNAFIVGVPGLEKYTLANRICLLRGVPGLGKCTLTDRICLLRGVPGLGKYTFAKRIYLPRGWARSVEVHFIICLLRGVPGLEKYTLARWICLLSGNHLLYMPSQELDNTAWIKKMIHSLSIFKYTTS